MELSTISIIWCWEINGPEASLLPPATTHGDKSGGTWALMSYTQRQPETEAKFLSGTATLTIAPVHARATIRGTPTRDSSDRVIRHTSDDASWP